MKPVSGRFKSFLPKRYFPYLSAECLKWLALLSMTADHVAVICKPIAGFREFGNLAFPLFAFLLTEGFFHTHDRKKYKLRLLFAALMSEIPYDLAFAGRFFDIHHQNVCLTLLISFVAMEVLEKYGCEIWEDAVILAVFCTIAEMLGADGGAWGVLLIIIFYFLSNTGIQHKKYMKAVAAAAVSIIAWQIPLWVAVLLLFLLFLYNGSKGNSKYRNIFYGYYPLHLMFLYFLSKFV